jgi:hypothetical protein
VSSTWTSALAAPTHAGVPVAVSFASPAAPESGPTCDMMSIVVDEGEASVSAARTRSVFGPGFWTDLPAPAGGFRVVGRAALA